MTDKIFADGFICKPPHQNAPDFVKAGISVKVGEAKAFLDQHQSNGWVNLQLKQSKGGKLYLELDTFKPTPGDSAQAGMAQARQAAEPAAQPAGGSFDDDIPF